METQNDYDREVFNGDLGTVARIDDEEGALVVNFDGREVGYPFGELDTLVPAFATTIHKSQGSEYPAVVIPVTTQHYTMLARNLALHGRDPGQAPGRARRPEEAVAIAVRGGQMKRRWTKLREWLSIRRRRGVRAAEECTQANPLIGVGSCLRKSDRFSTTAGPRQSDCRARIRRDPCRPSTRHVPLRSCCSRANASPFCECSQRFFAALRSTADRGPAKPTSASRPLRRPERIQAQRALRAIC